MGGNSNRTRGYIVRLRRMPESRPESRDKATSKDAGWVNLLILWGPSAGRGYPSHRPPHHVDKAGPQALR